MNDRALSTALAVSRGGRLRFDAVDDERSLGAEAARALARAAERSTARVLIELASAALLDVWLPPTLAFARDLAKLFFSHLCALPDLDTSRSLPHFPAPRDDLDALVSTAPPMTGGEYLSVESLLDAWGAMHGELDAEVRESGSTVAQLLREKSPHWSVVGRVCLHLAENKRDPGAPFAFLATYATRVSAGGRVQHAPLGRAVEEHAGAKARQKLLALLEPLHRAAQASPWLAELVASGDVFHPLAWTPKEAHAFLRDVPTLESSGVVVRVPDWWRARTPPRPRVEVAVGSRAPAGVGVGVDAMLDFRVSLTLEGEALSAAEQRAILAASEGLVLLKGKWVEIDRERLGEVLAHWKNAEKAAAKDGVSFAEAMRMLAGVARDAATEGGAAVAHAEWSRVTAGPWLDELLAELAAPRVGGGADPGRELRADLRPYQREGVAWLVLLSRLGLGACLADDMGLGKTIQVISLLLVLRRQKTPGPHLVVAPASLLGNWRAEIERFAPTIRCVVAHPSAMAVGDLRDGEAASLPHADVVLTTYGTVTRSAWLRAREWGLVVLDEAQAIKNPGARQTRAAKELRARSRVALTGTPVENRLGDLWSLFDFLNPGLLGSATEFRALTKRIEADPAQGFAPLRRLVRPYLLRRMKTDKSVVADLPDKTELIAHCALAKRQAALYQRAVEELAEKLDELDGIQRRGIVLAYLLRLKQICNHPSQWLGDGAYDPAESGKIARLRELCEPIAARQEKMLVFTQFREMTAPLERVLAELFGRKGLVLHGETPVRKRAELVAQFQDEGGPPFFVLSLKAGGTGLNLTAASHVVHFDRWWNPAVEAQATDRAFRIGQRRNVLVHKFVCRGTVEERVDALIESKRALGEHLFAGGAELPLTEFSRDELLSLVALDIRSALDEG